MDLVCVKSGPKTEKDRVALWELDDQHPATTEFPEGGEVFVANAKPRWVHRTPEVNLRLRDQRLVEVQNSNTQGLAPSFVNEVGDNAPKSKALSFVDRQKKLDAREEASNKADEQPLVEDTTNTTPAVTSKSRKTPVDTQGPVTSSSAAASELPAPPADE